MFKYSHVIRNYEMFNIDKYKYMQSQQLTHNTVYVIGTRHNIYYCPSNLAWKKSNDFELD